jgi:putative transposase
MSGQLFRRRNLPHWDMPGATYFVTSCLAGSLPADGLAELRQYQDDLDRRPRPEGLTDEEWERRRQKLIFARRDELLDGQPAVAHLANPAMASLVQTALLFFAGVRCDVFAFVVMPSHFHWVFRPTDEWVRQLRDTQPRSRLLQSIKTFTARERNKLLGRSGTFWQDESYDHWIRDLEELERVIRYVENNPVKAGLCQRPEDWKWSSANWRIRTGVPWGHPLPRG